MVDTFDSTITLSQQSTSLTHISTENKDDRRQLSRYCASIINLLSSAERKILNHCIRIIHALSRNQKVKGVSQ